MAWDDALLTAIRPLLQSFDGQTGDARDAREQNRRRCRTEAPMTWTDRDRADCAPAIEYAELAGGRR